VNFKSLSLDFDSLPSEFILRRVNRLTKQEQLVLCIVLGLLLMGWAVKVYRTAHPPKQASEQLKH
jgi:hypothetical protein